MTAGERRRRWPRRLLAAVAASIVAGTLASFGYNAATAGPARTPGGLEFVTAGGQHTRYRHWGTTGSPIVLIHGNIESADVWDGLGRVLAGHHRVYALDVAGWGYTERRGPYDVEHDAAQVLGLLDALRLDRATLVGHSTGAAIAAAAALRAPARVTGLVFLDGDGLDTGAGGDRLKSALFDPYRTTLLRLAVRSDLLIRSLYGAQCGPACPRLDRAALDRWRRPLRVAGAERALWAMPIVSGLPASRLAGLRRSPVPKAVIYGADDDVFARSSPYDTARLIGARAPTVIPGARHLSFVSHPARVAAGIDALLADGHQARSR